MMVTWIRSFNFIMLLVFTLCYCYQFGYVLVRFFKKQKVYTAKKLHKYAVLISARNEGAVIGELLESLHRQNYPQELLDIYVVADNCTDNTAQIAEDHRAIVYERFDRRLVGKGYALNYLFEKIYARSGLEAYDGYFVFDADTVLDENYVREMNKVFDNGYEIVTSYRNSKNYGSNWISAGYALWFLRESKYLNGARMQCGTSCAISGTGFLVANRIIRENNGWKHHLLTEDIEFSTDNIIQGRVIGYCEQAVLYDEQPTDFHESWTQRLRWSKGFYQVLFHYFKGLIASLRHGFKQGCEGESTPSTPGRRRFSCYDVFMTISPAMAITATSLCVNGIWLIAASNGMYADPLVYRVTFIGFFLGLLNTYLMFLGLGALTLVTERSRINATTGQMVRSAFVFPLFMLLQIPISVQALFAKVGWKPIAHTVNINLEQLAAAKK